MVVLSSIWRQLVILGSIVISLSNSDRLLIPKKLIYGKPTYISCFIKDHTEFPEITWYRGQEIIAMCDIVRCNVSVWENRHYRVTTRGNISILYIESLRIEDAVTWNCRIFNHDYYGNINKNKIKTGALHVKSITGTVPYYGSYVIQCNIKSYTEPVRWNLSDWTELVTCDKPKMCTRTNSPDGLYSFSSLENGIVLWIHSLRPERNNTFYCTQGDHYVKFIVDYKRAIDWGSKFTSVELEDDDNEIRCICTMPGAKVEPRMTFNIIYPEETEDIPMGTDYELKMYSCFYDNCSYISTINKDRIRRFPVTVACSCGVEDKSWKFFSDYRRIEINTGKFYLNVPTLFFVIAVFLALFCSYSDIRKMRLGIVGRFILMIKRELEGI